MPEEEKIAMKPFKPFRRIGLRLYSLTYSRGFVQLTPKDGDVSSDEFLSVTSKFLQGLTTNNVTPANLQKSVYSGFLNHQVRSNAQLAVLV